MEFLIFLLIVVFSIVEGNKQQKAKKTGAAQKISAVKRASPMESLQNLFDQAEKALDKVSGEWTETEAPKASVAKASPASKARAAEESPAVKRARATAARLLREANRAAATVPEGMSASETPTVMPSQGASLMDDEGCVGGSMAHAHTEGETHAEHRRHVEALHRREAEETRAAQAAVDLAAMNVQRMRQAVIMAEILDKPVALRTRRSRMNV